MNGPTQYQSFAAKLRAADEAYVCKHRKPYKGGYKVPSAEERYKFLSKKFNMLISEVSYFFTYSRNGKCVNHQWNEGACSECPVPAIQWKL